MKATAKTVRVCVLGSNPVMLAMKNVTALVNVEIVETSAEADLVVAESLQAIESGFSKEKQYVIITTEKVAGVPENVTVLKAPSNISDYCQLLSETAEKLTAVKEEMEEAEDLSSEIPLREDAKNILVIEDTLENIKSARKLLAGHKLTIADSYEKAMEILGKEKFEVVLTDLYLPMSSKTLSTDAFRIGELVPYGFLLMCEAARQGAKYVAVVTDLGHHSDHFSAAFDHFSRFALRIENAKAMMLHARIRDRAKEWNVALENLLED